MSFGLLRLVGSLLSVAAVLVYVVGGFVAFFAEVAYILNMWGGGGLFLTIILGGLPAFWAPFHAGLFYGDWMLFLLTYGVGILGITTAQSGEYLLRVADGERVFETRV